MGNYAQNVSNKRFISHEQRLINHFAFRQGKALFQLEQWLGRERAENLVWALSNAPKDKQVQWIEWYVDAMRIAGWSFDEI